MNDDFHIPSNFLLRESLFETSRYICLFITLLFITKLGTYGTLFSELGSV